MHAFKQLSQHWNDCVMRFHKRIYDYDENELVRYVSFRLTTTKKKKKKEEVCKLLKIVKI